MPQSAKELLEVIISRLDNGEEVYARRGSVYFPDRLAVVNCRFRVRECAFPVIGWYLATLFVDGEWVAQRRFEVTLRKQP